MCPAVTVVGRGPAAEAVVATLSAYAPDGASDAAGDGPVVTVERADEPRFDDAALGVVVDRVGDSAFATANEAGLETGTPWIAVELGGVGGYPVATAAVTGFGPDGACYDCLEKRVAANADLDADPVGAPDAAAQRVAGSVAGRAAVDVLDGDADAVLGRVTELPHADRRLLAVPGCDCGGDRDFSLGREYEDVDVETALARAEQGLDERVGVARQVGEAESFPAPYYLATLCDTSGFSDATAPRQAAGVATDWNAAFMKALGECYERYAAGVYTDADARTARATDLDAYVSPSAFVTPGEPAWDESTETEWVPATDLATGAATHVPADLVFHPPRNADVRPPLTTGLGLGSSSVEALCSGLYEVIERDAAMIAWYSSYEPLGLTVDDAAFETLADRAASEGLDVTTLLLTQDVDVPVVAAVVHRDESDRSDGRERPDRSQVGSDATLETWPQFAVGSAAHLDPVRAARGALEEAVQNWMELRGMGPDGATDASGAIAEYADLPDAGRDLIDVDQSVPAESVGRDEVPDGESHLDALVECVTDAGPSVYAARTTTRDVAEMGFEAVRILVPSAQPLFLGDAFFGDRARTVPEELGFEPRPDRPHHPFP